MYKFLTAILLTVFCISNAVAQDGDDATLDSLISVYHGLDDDDTCRLSVCNQIAWAHYNVDSTLMWSERLLLLARMHRKIWYEAKALGYLSWAYSYKNDFYNSADYGFKAVYIADSLGFSDIKAWNFYNIASLYRTFGNYSLSEKYCYDALAIYRKLDDKYRIASVLRLMGYNSTDQRNFNGALDFFSQAADIDSVSNDVMMLVEDYMCMGYTFTKHYMWDYSNADSLMLNKAMKLYLKALSYKTASLMTKYHLYSYICFNYFLSLTEFSHSRADHARRLADMGRYCDSLDFVSNKLGYEKAHFRSLLLRLGYYVSAKDLAKASSNADSVIYKLETDKMLDINTWSYWILSSYYKSLGDIDKAVYYSKLWGCDLMENTSIDALVQTSVYKLREEYENKIRKGQSQIFSRVSVFILVIFVVLAFLLFMYWKKSNYNKLLASFNKILSDMNIEIERQRDSLEDRNKLITDSLKYASIIQKAVLPNDQLMGEIFRESFVLYRPLHIVSGDFFWVSRVDGRVVLVCADCTGHGVPGGFLSMLGISLLNEIFSSFSADKNAADMLNLMREKLMKSLGQDKHKYDNGSVYAMDGIDLSLVIINEDMTALQYAGAYRPLAIWRNGELITYKPDKMPVGLYLGPEKNFTCHDVALCHDDILYMYSDGLPDQFGYLDDTHQECRHFSSKRFAKLLQSIGAMPMDEQKSYVETVFDNWRNGYPQLDDNILIGIRI